VQLRVPTVITVSVRVPPMFACRPPQQCNAILLTRDSTTNMPGINDALQQIDNLKFREKISYRRMAKYARCDRTTLSRRHRGVQVDINTKNVRQHKVTPQQYIVGLTERHFPPTREMIKNFVRGLAHVEVSEI
jgi:hypothetical protein